MESHLSREVDKTHDDFALIGTFFLHFHTIW